MRSERINDLMEGTLLDCSVIPQERPLKITLVVLEPDAGLHLRLGRVEHGDGRITA